MEDGDNFSLIDLLLKWNLHRTWNSINVDELYNRVTGNSNRCLTWVSVEKKFTTSNTRNKNTPHNFITVATFCIVFGRKVASLGNLSESKHYVYVKLQLSVRLKVLGTVRHPKCWMNSAATQASVLKCCLTAKQILNSMGDNVTVQHGDVQLEKKLHFSDPDTREINNISIPCFQSSKYWYSVSRVLVVFFLRFQYYLASLFPLGNISRGLGWI